MLFIIGQINKALTCCQGYCVTAGTFAVQADITRPGVIDIMIGPVAAGVTGRTGIRTALITLGRADQGIPGAVTGGTPIMYLRVATVGEGGRRVDVTDQAAGITGDIPGADMVNIAMDGHKLVVVTLKAVDRAEVVHVGDGIQHVLPRTVMTGGTRAGAVGSNIVFDTFDLRPGRDNVTATAKDARWVIDRSPAVKQRHAYG